MIQAGYFTGVRNTFYRKGTILPKTCQDRVPEGNFSPCGISPVFNTHTFGLESELGHPITNTKVKIKKKFKVKEGLAACGAKEKAPKKKLPHKKFRNGQICPLQPSAAEMVT